MTTCRICRCTDDDCRRCIEKTGAPCSWVEPELCSACEGTFEHLAQDAEVLAAEHGVDLKPIFAMLREGIASGNLSDDDAVEAIQAAFSATDLNLSDEQGALVMLDIAENQRRRRPS